jgi:hypothetical protein
LGNIHFENERVVLEVVATNRSLNIDIQYVSAGQRFLVSVEKRKLPHDVSAEKTTKTSESAEQASRIVISKITITFMVPSTTNLDDLEDTKSDSRKFAVLEEPSSFIHVEVEEWHGW